jgi:hypothetical protein
MPSTAAAAAAGVRTRGRGPWSLAANASNAFQAAWRESRRAWASRSILWELSYQNSRNPSASGMGDGIARKTSGGPCFHRGWGFRATSSQAGVCVWSQALKRASSLRVRGSTVMKRPPCSWMCLRVARVQSLLSAT